MGRKTRFDMKVLIHTSQFKLWSFEVLPCVYIGKPWICNVFCPSVHYLECTCIEMCTCSCSVPRVFWPVYLKIKAQLNFSLSSIVYNTDIKMPFCTKPYKECGMRHEARKVVKVPSLSEPLTAERVSGLSDPYSVYGTEIPGIVPGSKEFWRSFYGVPYIWKQKFLVVFTNIAM